MSKKRRRELRAQAIWGIVLAILFVVTAVPALLLTNLELRLFDPLTYQETLADINIYDALPGLIARQLHHAATYDACYDNPLSCRFPNASPETRACLDETLGKTLVDAIIRNERRPTGAQVRDAQQCFTHFGTPVQSPTPPPPAPVLFAIFTPEQIESILAGIMPAPELRAFADQSLADILAYTGGESDTLTISLAWLKQGLTERGTDAILSAINSQPPCTAEQVTHMALDLALNQSPQDLFTCSPPKEVSLLMKPFINVAIITQSALIPNSIPLGELPTVSGINIIDSVGMSRTLIRYSGVVPLVLLLALSLVTVRGLRSWLIWWGIPLLNTGILTLGLSALVIPLVTGIIHEQVAASLPTTFLPEIADMIETVMVNIISNLLAPISIQSVAISATGLIMLLSARFLRK